MSDNERIICVCVAVSIVTSLLIAPGLLWKHRDARFPRLPLWSRLPKVSTEVARYLLVAVVSLQLLAVVLPAYARVFACGTVAWSMFVIVLDEHMIFPQLVHFTIASLSLGLDDEVHLKLFFVCLYTWGGIQKSNERFVSNGCIEFFRPCMERYFSFTSTSLPLGVRRVLGTCVAIGESCLGVGLLFESSQQISAVGLIGMHVGILVAIGPLGANRFHPIWPWNVMCIALLLALFVFVGERDESYGLLCDILAMLSDHYDMNTFVLIVEIGLFVFAPALSFFELWLPNLSFMMHSYNFPSVEMTLRWSDVDASYEDVPFRLYELAHKYHTQPVLSVRGFRRWGQAVANALQCPVSIRYQGRPQTWTGHRVTRNWESLPR